MSVQQFGLSLRQKDVLDFIKSYCRDTGGVSPTITEICEGLKAASRSSIHRILKILVDKGHIQMLPYRARSIIVID